MRSRASTSTHRCGDDFEPRVVAHRVAHEVVQLGQRLGARVARADEHEAEVAVALLGVELGVRGLELAQHVVAELDPVREVVESARVLARGPGTGSERVTAPSAITRFQ